MAALIFLGYAISVLIIAVFTLFLAFTFLVWRKHKLLRHIPGPKRSSFYLGNLSEFMKNKNILTTIERWKKEHGPILAFYGLHEAAVVCSDVSVIKELMTRTKYLKAENQYRPFNTLFGVRSLGTGLVSEMDHERWAKKRALFNPAFHRRYLMGLMDQFNSSSDQLTEHLTQSADGLTEVKMLDEFGRLTLDIIAKVGFGLDEGVITNPDHPLCKLVPMLALGMQKMYENPFLERSPLPKDVKFKRKIRESVRHLRKIGRQCIEARMAAIQQGDDVPRDILTYILEASNNLQEDQDFGMENMLDEFCTFFTAGQETTANLLSFTLLHLGQHPEVLAKLKEEVDTIVEDKDFIEYSDITKLQYMTLVLKESLRLNPPIGLANRVLPCDTELCGYKLPKGTVVLMSTYIMGRDEKHFKDPLKFDPERFTREEDKPLFAYFPFALGARSCIGQVFAMIEAKVILCKLLRKFEFRLVPGQSLDHVEELTMKPRDGCRNFITLR